MLQHRPASPRQPFRAAEDCRRRTPPDRRFPAMRPFAHRWSRPRVSSSRCPLPVRPHGRKLSESHALVVEQKKQPTEAVKRRILNYGLDGRGLCNGLFMSFTLSIGGADWDAPQPISSSAASAAPAIAAGFTAPHSFAFSARLCRDSSLHRRTIPSCTGTGSGNSSALHSSPT